MMEFLTVIFMITCVFVAINAGFMLFEYADELYHRIVCRKDNKKNKKNVQFLEKNRIVLLVVVILLIMNH